MDTIGREIAGFVYYLLLGALLLWLLFRGPLGTHSEPRIPTWVSVAVVVAVGAGVLAGITYELLVKRKPPPCPCGLPGCPPPPACDVIREEHNRYR